MGVYISALSNFRLGLQLAVAIMLHNIPEGMACAIPLWAAVSKKEIDFFKLTKNRQDQLPEYYG